MSTSPSARPLRPRALAGRAALALVVGLSIAAAWALTGRYALDLDVVNLALGVQRFDVVQHQPHPPGYLGYVGLMRVVRAVTGGGLLDVPRVTSRLCAAAAVVFTWVAAGRLLPGRPGARLGAALLAAAHPLLLYYAVDGQTHAAEAAVTAAALALVAGERRGGREAALAGLLVAVGGSLRATAVVPLTPLLVAAFWGRWRAIAGGAAVALAGTAAWLVPTVWATGGWAAYRAVTDALVGELVARSSLLSSHSRPDEVARQLTDASLWGALACAPALLAAVVRPAAPEAGAARRRAAQALALTAGPTLLLCLLVLCAEPGYLLALVPAAALVGGVGAHGAAPDAPLAGVRGVGLLVGAQLAFFVAAPAGLFGRTFPTLDEMATREQRQALLFQLLFRERRPDERLLVLSDFPEPTALRQAPLLRPGTHVLFVHRARWLSHGRQGGISVATEDGWVNFPGALPLPGATALRAPAAYDGLLIDPLSTEALRAELRAHSRCPIPPRDQAPAGPVPVLDPRCFDDAPALVLEGRRFELSRR
jgi:hypothetical protein